MNTSSHKKLVKTFKDKWDLIADFEKHELEVWKHAHAIQWEARTSERMKAYIKLIETMFEEYDNE